MKQILYLVLVLSLILGSCEKFLEETPTGSITTEANLTSNASGVALATGAYRSLPSVTYGVSEWGGNLLGGLEYFTGKAYSQYMGAKLFKYEGDTENGEEDYFTYPWRYWYQGVRDCNLAIMKIPGVTGLSADEKSKYLGEVRTLRAWYYFNLVRHYGDVVYNTDVVTDLAVVQRPRRPLVAIYDKIILPDLEFAVNESKLVDERSTGRVTKHVARALLADVYLTMAGYPYQEEKTDTTKAWCTDGLWAMTAYPVNSPSAKDFLQKAKTQLDFLYGKYPIGDFTDLNKPEMDNKGGAIWQVQFLLGTTAHGAVQCFVPLSSHTTVLTTETGTIIPSVAYSASFNPADKRIADRAYFYYSDTYAAKYDVNEGPAGKFPLPFLYKYYDYNCMKVKGESGLNFNLYRYADILLMLTEVNWSLKQLGVSVTDDDIVKGINEVKTRAGLATMQASNITLFDIMSERAYELIFEGKMLWDMRRTRKALVDGVGQFTRLENLVGHQPTNFSYKFSAKHLLSPVSVNEIANNTKVTQNYGWLPIQVGQ
jgi:hypothetical protein